MTRGRAFSLGKWRVDPSRLALLGEGREVVLEPKTMDVLVYLAEHAGEVVTSDELIDGVWEGRAMGDGPVYGAIAKLRRALDDDARHPRYIATVARRGYQLLTEPVWENTSRASRLPRITIAVAIVALAGLVAMILLFDQSAGPTGRELLTNEETSLAVLPFTSISADDRNQYLGHGFSEDLLNALSRTPRLRVIARATAFRLGASDVEFSQLAEDLNVDFVLNGSVRQEGRQLRITAQLIDRDAQLIWSDSFDRTLDDALEIQQEIAMALADRLALRLSDHNARLTVTGDAYMEYLLGRDYVRLGLIDWADEAQQAFERAIELEPGFANAHAGLARVLHHERELERARHHVDLALSLDPEAAEAYFVNGLLSFPLQFGLAESHFRKALQLNPNLSEARQFLAFSLEGLDRRPEAFRERQVGLARDPLHYGLNRNIAFDYSATGKIDLALDALERAMALPQSDIPALDHRIRVLMDWTRYDEIVALEQYYDDPELDHPKFRTSLAAALTLSYSRLEKANQASRWYEVAREQDEWPHLGPPLFNRIQYLGETGQTERLLEEMESLNSELPDYFPGTRTRLELERDVMAAKVIAHVFRGEMEAAIQIAGESPETLVLSPAALEFLALAYFQDGRQAVARSMIEPRLQRLQQIESQGFAAYPAAQAELARLYALTGDAQSADQALSVARDMGWNGTIEFQADPRWRGLTESGKTSVISGRESD